MILDEAGTEDHIHELFVNGMIDMLDQEQQLVDALEENSIDSSQQTR